jgi:hypothetical protein
MKDLQELARTSLKYAQEDMKKYHDRRAREQPVLKEGDLVLIEATNIHSDRSMKKLGD